MRKTLLILLALTLALSLPACGGNPHDEAKSAAETHGEETTQDSEAPIEEAPAHSDAQGDEDISLMPGSDQNDGITPVPSAAVDIADNTPLPSDEGQGESLMQGDWPDDELTKMIPKPAVGKLIMTSTVMGNGFLASIEGFTEADAAAYMEGCKAMGWVGNINREPGMDFEGLKGEWGIEVVLESGTLTIIIGKPKAR